MSSKQMNFAFLLSIFGVDAKMPIIVNVKGSKITAARDGTEVSVKSADPVLFPTAGLYKVTITSEDPSTVVVLKTAEQKVVKQSPTFDSY